MLALLNRYAHGYVAVPVILACRRHRLFETLSVEQSISFPELARALHANTGHLRVALRLLESLGWVSQDVRDVYHLKPAARLAAEIPEDILTLLTFPFDRCLSNDDDESCSLKAWIERSVLRWGVSDASFADYLDGLFVLPLLLALKTGKLPDASGTLSALPKRRWKEIGDFFAAKGWIKHGAAGIEWTAAGRFLAGRVLNVATVVSYTPLLVDIAELIFGDCKKIFERDALGDERHIDRTLNVKGSGFQHQKYFSDMEETVCAIFNREPLADQPKYVADMGCGDGSLLHRVYETIARKTVRGQSLDKYPLTVIGVDFNQKALEQTRLTLQNIPHIAIAGDIGDPARLLDDLKNHGVSNPDDVLHVRTFLDHDRPYRAPEDRKRMSERAVHAYVGVYVDPEGGEISPAYAIQSLVEHLARWAGAVGKHGLLTAEVHCLAPRVVARHLDAENLHFDAYHAFSRQLLVSAEEFLMAAAEVGLFPNPRYFQKYPKTLPFTRITLNHFERHDHSIRYAKPGDLPALVELDRLCWAPHLRVSRQTIAHRIKHYPQGQLVIEVEGRVAGVVYSQRISGKKALAGLTAVRVDALHQPNGPIVQLLALNISPDMQQRRLGDKLLEFMLQRCAVMSDVDGVIGVTRCRDYYAHTDVPFAEYLRRRDEHGLLIDPILRFHELHGATITQAVPNYRPRDKENQGYGALVEYDLRRRRRRDVTSAPNDDIPVSRPQERDEASIARFVTEAIGSLIGDKEFSLSRPLLELGLDSADLLELGERLRHEFGVAIEATFFFEHNTGEQVIANLRARLGKTMSMSRVADNVPLRAVSEKKPLSPTKPIVHAEAAPSRSTTDVAIVGVACRLPGNVSTKDDLWRLLVEGRSAIGSLPPGRWQWPPEIDPTSSPGIDRGGFVEDIASFDATFFRLSPREAQLMDPQQRLLLELAWACLEDAAHAPATLAGTKTGVYIGASGSDYQRRLNEVSREVDSHFGLATSMAVLANRISYFYDFRGPSLQIDTACSSSLVALHEALQALHAGHCTQALVGGINLMCHPANTITYYKAGMLAPDGRCKTFDQSANGYVRAEGAVMVLLKPLSQAQRDGDRIYACIKGSAVNHGGQSGGLTVPHPTRQADLIVDACTTAGISPGVISYVEAHGTGTRLGDPIEIRGLKEAFVRLAGNSLPGAASCGIGSIKTNLGHLEAAAGLAGLLKVLLSFQHRMLPASIHFNALNSEISLADSPLYVVDKNRIWHTNAGVPRYAGVSSFGSGGVNAHVLLAEYADVANVASSLPTSACPALLLLSAKSAEQLKRQAGNLVNAITTHGFTDADLLDVAYTLQVGRASMEHRLAFTARSIDEVKAKLRAFLDENGNPTAPEGCYVGEMKSAKDALGVLHADEDIGLTLDAWFAKGKYAKLLELWAKGFSIDWYKLYRDGAPYGKIKPKRLSLPTYPFAREHYWIEPSPSRTTVAAEFAQTASVSATALHPLLHRNISTFDTQCFSTTFTGDEFFLRDHIVQGRKILPAVCYLEMMRAAGTFALGARTDGPMRLRLTDVIFLQPIVVTGTLEVRVALRVEEGGAIAGEIYTVPDANRASTPQDESRVVHMQARVRLDAHVQEIRRPAPTPDEYPESLSVAVCYDAFAASGLHYGPTYRAIETLARARDTNGRPLVHATLRRPAVTADESRYVLHPSLMDAALQAAMTLMDEPSQAGPLLPFAVEAVEVHRSLPSFCMAFVREVTDGGTRRFDVDLVDDIGEVCVAFRGFSLRASSSLRDPVERSLLAPVWEVSRLEHGDRCPNVDDRLLIVGGEAGDHAAIRALYPNTVVAGVRATDAVETMVDKLDVDGSFDHIVWICPRPASNDNGATIVGAQTAGAIFGFRLIKALLQRDYGTRPLDWTVITVETLARHRGDAIYAEQASVHGLIGALAKEYPHWRLRLVDLPREGEWPLAEIFTLTAESSGDARLYRDGQWYRERLAPLALPTAAPAFRVGGVYVVLGGAGGIGEAFSEYLIRRYAAHIVWIGRRAPDEAIRQKIERLAAFGTTPMYVQADATDRAALADAYVRIKNRHAHIHGVIHSAIVLQDKSLALMDEERFCASLVAKVDTSVHLMDVFGAEPLDLALFFSSVQTFLKLPGQSNYAAGCTFQRAYAEQLVRKSAYPVKVMHWGYWGHVGVVATPEYRVRMAQRGFESIEPPEAMTAIERVVAAPILQAVMLKNHDRVELAHLDFDSQETIVVAAGAGRSVTGEMRGAVSADVPPSVAALAEPLKALDVWLAQRLFVQLRHLGQASDAPNEDSRTRGASTSYARWLDASRKILQAYGYPGTEGGDAARCEHPQLRAHVTLAERTLEALPEILTGGRRPTDVLFPDGAMDLVESIYRSNPIADYFNDKLADAVVAYVAARTREHPDVRLRLLEVGAGTGSTSAVVLRKLDPYRARIAEYTYSDVSPAFLTCGERTFAATNPFVTYRLIDVESPLTAQGIEGGHYDIVIAANVLHATRDIRRTVRHVKSVLKHNGWLLLNEVTANSLFAHLTFGLLEGWWRFNDAEMRLPGSPVLSPARWRQVLEDEGLSDVMFLVENAQMLGQQVIAAQSDGLVRQPKVPDAMTRSAPPEVPSPVHDVAVLASQERVPVSVVQDTGVNLRERVVFALRKVVGGVLRTPVDRLDASAALEQYGIDSILALQVVKELRAVFSNVSSTLLFEHQTIDSLAEHFLKTSHEELVRWIGGEKTARSVAVPPLAAATPPAIRYSRLPLPSTSHLPSRSADTDAIAIIGLAGRYPEAKTVTEFWNNLKEGRNCIREIPKERWDWRDYWREDKQQWGDIYTKWGGFLGDIDKFDPLFFGISPREAERIDPQERLFLEEAYACLEDAGYAPARISSHRAVGVFVGVMNSAYGSLPSYWSIANRVSYLLGFRGPSLAVDTACSSSLTAIHLACESIKRGDCDLAIAGGVNLIVSPLQYAGLSALGMLSHDDRCKAFGDGADGFVDGEGVGAVLLKPLARAVEDGDQIYGVIKATHINHGGKTNGYTVPNPNAQRDLIRSTLDKAGIHSRAVSYVEAHGTGTSLGDPIEIAGLAEAFRADTADTQYCALGSAKSNIGHLESAAGIAGITKVLLQLKHRMLVPTLHVETLNPHIDFAKTPFAVQRTLSEWTRPTLSIDGEAREYPRIAGVSSFGAGGANAHVIVEEYVSGTPIVTPVLVAPTRPAMVVLSARNAERLQVQAQNLLDVLDTRRFSDADLLNIAYTLQVGRDAMESRLAFTAASIEEVKTKLRAFVEGRAQRGEIEACYVGEIKSSKDSLGGFNSDEDTALTIGAWLTKGKYGKLLDVWANGFAFDWAQLYAKGAPYGGLAPRRVSLPTYPFARERYWIDSLHSAATLTRNTSFAGRPSSDVLHPLLHRNTSTIDAQRFSTTFTGEEFFLRDHVIQGQKMLPGACYLEMFREAVRLSLGKNIVDASAIELSEVTWWRPLIVDQPCTVNVALYPQAQGEFALDVYRDDGEVTVRYAQARARISAIPRPVPVDVATLATYWGETVRASSFYARFQASGYAYGPTHRGLTELSVGQGIHGDSVVRAQLNLPSEIARSADAFVLHPSLLDSALQAVVGFSLDRESKTAAVPFALASLRCWAPLPARVLVVLRRSAGTTSAVSKLDIDICTEKGEVCVALRGFSSREYTVEAAETRLYAPRWEKAPFSPTISSRSYREHWVFVCDLPDGEELTKSLQTACPRSRCEFLSNNKYVGLDDAPAVHFDEAARTLLNRLQRILAATQSTDAVLLQLLLPDETSLFSGLGGMLKSAQQEHPNWTVQLIRLPAGIETNEAGAIVEANAATGETGSVRYRDGVRWIERVEEITPKSAPISPWRSQGIYLITGGFGGVGRIVAKAIATDARIPTLILVGRSVLDSTKQAFLEELVALGAKAEYRVLDVSDYSATDRLVQEIVSTYGALHGVIHTAGVLHDSFLTKKTVDEFSAVFGPKVHGTMNLDRATKALTLDHFILFSSLAGVFGNVGQADYSAANAFLDAFAHGRNVRRQQGRRHGRTVAIDWPYWSEGGMSLDAATLARLRERLGIQSLPSERGVRALYQSLALDIPQVMVLHGAKERFERAFESPATIAPVSTMAVAPADGPLTERARTYLKRLVAEGLKLAPDRLDAEAPFEKYGIDSVVAVQLTNDLERVFGPLSKTLFFEHQTLVALTDHFLTAHRATLETLLGDESNAVAARTLSSPTGSSAAAEEVTFRQVHRTRFAPAAQTHADDTFDIAVIGMSGRYPKASTLEEFWKNLRDGVDCVTEIPAQRWDHGLYFDSRKHTPAKTYSRWGGFLDDVDKFDPLLFGISPRDAETMDPQERLFLETAWHTFEDAGYAPESLRRAFSGNVGVFVGVMYAEYQLCEGAAEQGIVSSLGSIANRVSYVFDLNGPSMAVDTLCSSSLTALHLAVESLRRGECACAIAGGVNLSIHPVKYLTLARMTMASSDGRCRSFGAGGDGFVPSEGVGAVLLKPLARARSDGDRIYGVIKSTRINAGGRTHGYTVPNPQAQYRVVAEALRQAGVSARAISYVEAHGTGTALGDPIEITGLAKAFAVDTPDRQFCAIGSVKSNIGHAESAAGIAGLTKVLLQMRHRTIVPSLHAQELNPNVDFAQTPFVVQRQVGEWKRPVIAIDGEARELPRIAGVSSFGAGGANAHVIVEEYVEEDEHREAPSSRMPVAIVLSAKSEERLRVYASQVHAALSVDRWSDADLIDIAYTLQVGRAALEHRLAFVAASLAEVRESLEAYFSGAIKSERLIRGDTRDGNELLDLFKGDVADDQTFAKWIEQGKIHKVLALWARGVSVDWTRLYGATRPRRVSLPGYPFARTRYWIPRDVTKEVAPSVRTTESAGTLHPLLHRDTSPPGEQRFSTTFTGGEFFLRDHRIEGRRVLPAAAYLEMARAALERSPAARPPVVAVQIRNVTFVRPLAVSDSALTVHLSLESPETGETRFSIFSVDDAERRLYAQGIVEQRTSISEPTIDLSGLARGCRRTMSGEDCYNAFAAMGITYGAAHRVITRLDTGSDDNGHPYALARLSLPEIVPTNGYVLHPSLLDGAFQACLGLEEIVPAASPVTIFGLRTLDTLRTCGTYAIAYVRYSEKKADGTAREIDIDICEESGAVCVRIRGAVARPLSGTMVKPDSNTTHRHRRLYPTWTTIALTFEARKTSENILLVGSESHVDGYRTHSFPQADTLVIDAAHSVAALTEALKSRVAPAQIFWFAPEEPIGTSDEAFVTAQARGVLACLRFVKALSRAGYGETPLRLTVVTVRTQPIASRESINPAHASLQGFVGSVAKEHKAWSVCLVDLESSFDPALPSIGNARDLRPGETLVRRRGEWYRQALIPCEPTRVTTSIFRVGGVYVILGGAGGVGEVFTEYLLRTYQAHVVWLGRRARDASLEQALARLAQFGPTPHYIQADATDRAALQRAHEEIKKRYGRISGVVHSALHLQPGDIARMEESRFEASLAAKVQSSVNFAEVFGHEALDFFLFFSSTVSFAKTARQASYAAGSTFMDAFAHRMAQESKTRVKVINWSYWGSVGREANSAGFQKWLAESRITGIDPAEAMRELETLLTGPFTQMAFLPPGSAAAVDGLIIDETAVTRTCDREAPAAALQALSLRAEPFPVDAIADVARERFERLMARLLLAELRSIGLLDDGRREGNSLPNSFYPRWWEATLSFLTQHGLIRNHRDSIEIADRTDRAALWAEWERESIAWRDDANIKCLFVLVDATLRALTDVLTGKRLATDVLFPHASTALIEGVYKDNPPAVYFNEVMADVLAAYIDARKREEGAARLRILEIGAGTGGTSVVLFRALARYREHIEEYRYTDISPTFLLHAEEIYRPHNPYVTTQRLDVEVSFEKQGIEMGHFDIVVAANVLHATTDVRAALRNAKWALKRHGVLLVNELTANSVFLHLTFGLLDGWWRYEDTALRLPGFPGLSPDTWRHVLETEGFAAVAFPADAAHRLGQQIVAAASDGIVRGRGPQNADPIRETRAASVSAMSSETLARSTIDTSEMETYVRQTIKEELSASLKINSASIHSDQPFADYGLDSIAGVRMIEAINRRLSLELLTTTLFDHSSVKRLAAHICTEHGAAIASMLRLAKASVAPTDRSPTPQEPISAAIPSLAATSRRRDDDTTSSMDEAIAVIGMSGRFASANSVDELWTALASGRDLTEPVKRWDLAPLFAGSDYCRRGGFIADIDRFDAAFFNISGIEAICMEPQQRLFLEEAWKALEIAGYVGASIDSARCGVYVGHNGNDYAPLLAGNAPAQAMWGNAASVTSARIAYYLNLKGPAVTVDTACSSSLVGVHLACQALRASEVDLALAGGVFVQSTPTFYLTASRAGMLSTQGHCYTFDARADGFVPGESVGVLVLKRLSDALRDRDPIYGVIRGSAINQDGTTNGITAPSALSQEALERYVYEKFDIHPESIQMVEAHGTGTKLGDPIEIVALTRAFRKDTDKKQYCAIGSIKTNIGHTTAASGVAGTIKALLALQHRQIPPSLHYQTTNPNIVFADSPFYVSTVLTPWEAPPGMKRRAAVSSFGMSGTNAHLVVEEAPAIAYRSPVRPAHLIVLSAKTTDQLRALASRFTKYLEAHADIDLGNASYTLLIGRRHFEHRLACVVSDVAMLRVRLAEWLAGGEATDLYSGEVQDNEGNPEAALRGECDRLIERCVGVSDAIDSVRHLCEIAQRYTQGHPLTLDRLFDAGCYARIPLPTYPLSGKRYWATQQPVAEPVVAPRSASDTIHAAPTPVSTPTPTRAVTPGTMADTVDTSPSILSIETLQQEITESLASALYIDPVDIDPSKAFIDLGMDSVIGVEWMRTLNKRYGTSLPATRLYDFPTVRELARVFANAMRKPADTNASVSAQDAAPLSDVLRQLYDGAVDVEGAKTLLQGVPATIADERRLPQPEETE